MMGKIRLKISPWWAVSMAVLYFLNGSTTFIIMVISAFFHELSHVIAMLLCGVSPLEVTFGFLNFNIKYNKNITSYSADIFISLAGIVANILISVWALYMNYEEIFFVNFSLAVANMLPLEGLDGGNIILSLAEMRKKDKENGYSRLFYKSVRKRRFNKGVLLCFFVLCFLTKFNLSVVFSGISFIAMGEINNPL